MKLFTLRERLELLARSIGLGWDDVCDMPVVQFAALLHERRAASSARLRVARPR